MLSNELYRLVTQFPNCVIHEREVSILVYRIHYVRQSLNQIQVLLFLQLDFQALTFPRFVVPNDLFQQDRKNFQVLLLRIPNEKTTAHILYDGIDPFLIAVICQKDKGEGQRNSQSAKLPF